MMKGKPKIGLLMGLGPPKGGKPSMSSDDDDDAAEQDAAKEFASAIKSGDPDEIIMAFKNMQAACELG